MRLLGHFVEELDLSDLYSTYSKVKENQVSPRQMLKIMLYAYHERNYSSANEVADCTLVEIKIEKLVPDISEKKQYTVAMNVISAHINRNV